MNAQPASQAPADYDVIIMGGAFSGASAGLMLKRDLPNLRVLIIERTTAFDRKVGESTSEVAACFLTRVLHLGSYLNAFHYQKHGLRMWFCKKPDDTVEDCTELGPKFQSRLPTYQLDRALLDQHVLEEAVKEGCELLRPATLQAFELQEGQGNHSVTVKTADGAIKTYACRWLIDASGKAAIMSKKLGLHRPMDEQHQTSSVWFRMRNVTTLDSAKARKMHPVLMKNVRATRSSATNHLMGRGWWVWIIPLSNGDYSVGIVWDRSIYTLPAGGSLTDRLKAHLMTHPVGRLMFADAEAIEDDTFYYKGLAYYTEQMAGNRWFMVGDAAGFMDPLYSQGLDFCAHTVCAATDVIKRATHGEDVSAAMEYLRTGYKRSYFLWFNSLYRNKYEYLGDAELVRISFIMDLGTYFVGPVRLVYDKPDIEFKLLPYNGNGGAFFAGFMTWYNKRLVTLAKKRLAKGTYGAWNNHMDLTLGVSYTPNFSALKFLRWGLRLLIMAELRTLFGKAPKNEMEDTMAMDPMPKPMDSSHTPAPAVSKAM
jgi:flavin-dependent dehydrogenase